MNTTASTTFKSLKNKNPNFSTILNTSTSSAHLNNNAQSNQNQRQAQNTFNDYKCEYEVPKFCDLNAPDEQDYLYSAVGHIAQQQQAQKLLKQQNYENQADRMGSITTHYLSKSPGSGNRILNQSLMDQSASSNQSIDLFFDWFQEYHDFKIEKPQTQPQKQTQATGNKHFRQHSSSNSNLNSSFNVQNKNNYKSSGNQSNLNQSYNQFNHNKPALDTSMYLKSNTQVTNNNNLNALAAKKLAQNNVSNQNIDIQKQQQNSAFSYNQQYKSHNTFMNKTQISQIAKQNHSNEEIKENYVNSNQKMQNQIYGGQPHKKRKAEEADISQVITNGANQHANPQIYKKMKLNTGEMENPLKTLNVSRNSAFKTVGNSNLTEKLNKSVEKQNQIDEQHEEQEQDRLVEMKVYQPQATQLLPLHTSSEMQKIYHQSTLQLKDCNPSQFSSKANPFVQVKPMVQTSNTVVYKEEVQQQTNQMKKLATTIQHNPVTGGGLPAKINFIEKNKMKIREMSDCTGRVKQPVVVGRQQQAHNQNLSSDRLDYFNDQIKENQAALRQITIEQNKKIRPKTVNVVPHNKENAQPNSTLQTPTMKFISHNFRKNNLNLQTPGAANGAIVNTSSHLLNQSQLAKNLSENFNTLNLSNIKNQQNLQSTGNLFKSQQNNTGVGFMPVSSVTTQAQSTLNQSSSQKFFYEPPLFSQRLIRKWENMTGKVWYQLSPKSRMQVNNEISNLKYTNTSSNQMSHNTSQLNQGGHFNGLFSSTTSLATGNQQHQSAFMKTGGAYNK
eukprot:403367206